LNVPQQSHRRRRISEVISTTLRRPLLSPPVMRD
jgi:hypothetical protein